MSHMLVNDGIVCLQKFGEYVLSNNLIARLQAKVNSIQKALGEGDYSNTTGTR